MTFKKTALISLFFLLLNVAFAQVTDTFHYYIDHDENPVDQPASIYHVRVFKEKQTDENWKRVQTTRFDEKMYSTGNCIDKEGKIKQGDFVVYFNTGAKCNAGRYENNKKEGEWKGWHPNGQKASVFNYHADERIGTNKSWYESGKPDDEFLLDDSGNGAGIGYYESGQKKYEGNFAKGLKTGVWFYYYDDSAVKKSMEVEFNVDTVLISKCFTINGAQQSNCIFEAEANFKGGHKYWMNYLSAELGASGFPKFMKRIDLYRVVVAFVVAKDGSIVDVKVENPGIKKLDKIAEKIISDSPPWSPAIQYNQKVNAYRRQPLTFMVQ